MDLLETDSLGLVKSAFHYLEDTLLKAGDPVPQNLGGRDRHNRNLDCAVLLALHELRQKEEQIPFDSVRAAFMEGDDLYPDAGFKEKNHIQICIRNTECIKGFFLPRFDGVEPLP